jgi:pyruvate/2-oxoglutarate dehydrogenase complex dihydrolipoamide acyltransferase (E2) component
MIVSIRIPQMGEGLQEALLVEFLKKPGDTVKRDEPLYVMETDKATTDVESPYSGKLIAWTVIAGSVLPIGTEIGKMEVADGVKEMPTSHNPTSASQSTSSAQATQPPMRVSNEESPASSGDAADAADSGISVMIPPKTRKHLKDLGLMQYVGRIPVSGSKMMPEDVDAFVRNNPQLVGQSRGSLRDPTLVRGVNHDSSSDTNQPSSTTSNDYVVVPLPKSQISLNYRLHRSAQTCVPVTLMADIDWSAIMAARDSLRGQGGPTGFAMACWSVVQAMKQHSKFRSSLNAEGNALKVFHRVNLGIAVALPGDEMVTAVIAGADQMTESEFFTAYENRVQLARTGKDQADDATTMIVSNIGKVGMRIGIPAIVAPAVATLAIGEVFQQPIPTGDTFRFQPTATATLSFDHRIANGVGAANFLNDIRQGIAQYGK